MKKIPTIYERDWGGNPRYVTQFPNPECAWVFAGEGMPTRKYDGTCVRFDGENWWARREVKADRPRPDGFVTIDRDVETGKYVGWEPIEQSGFRKFLVEALLADRFAAWEPGTYELCGPKVNGNPEKYGEHRLIAHVNAARIRPFDLNWTSIRDMVHLHADNDGVEGIVWHHEDGRMAKIKARDFPRDLICKHCGANLSSGVLAGTGGVVQRACPNCDPDHPLSVARRAALVEPGKDDA